MYLYENHVYIYKYIYAYTPEIQHGTWKATIPIGKTSSSSHHFSGANSLVNLRGGFAVSAASKLEASNTPTPRILDSCNQFERVPQLY